MKNLIFKIYAWLYDKYVSWTASDTVIPAPQPEIPLVRTVSELNSTPVVAPVILPEPIEAPKPIKRKYTRRVQLKTVTRTKVKTTKKKNARRKNSS
jgi:hypothetical protein